MLAMVSKVVYSLLTFLNLSLMFYYLYIIVLNAESPLLKREVRDMIVKDGGKWDKGMSVLCRRLVLKMNIFINR